MVFPGSAPGPQHHGEKAVATFLPVRELASPNLLLTSCVTLTNWLVSLSLGVSGQWHGVEVVSWVCCVNTEE